MRINAKDSLALCIDMQEKLLPHIYFSDKLVSRCKKLISGLSALQVPTIVTEQYKKGLGDTVPVLDVLLADNPHYEKKSFSCCHDPAINSDLELHDKKNIILFGIEAHICVLQTAIDLMERGYNTIVVTNCISSRKQNDTLVALTRLQQEGVRLTTYESLMFELCETSENPVFRTIQQLVK